MINDDDLTSEQKQLISELNSPFIDDLHSEGITSKYLAKLLKKELTAKQVKVFQHQGQVIYSDPIDALEVQQKARMDANKLMNHYPAEKHEVEGTVFQVIDYAKPKKEE